MNSVKTLDGILFARMINSGAANLKAHAEEINDLNVFPIPDGDTGDNMLMTMMGGVHREFDCDDLCQAAERVSGGMLLSARGNSGVILSQFFEGIRIGFDGVHTADVAAIGKAFRDGVAQAYRSVMTPTEGTILTVIREATEYACMSSAETPEDFLNAFIEEAKRSLARTPELLPVLKKAGVVDSGAAGLIYIVDGMLHAVSGDDILDLTETTVGEGKIDLNAFDENSVLEFGYCTELLLRLQTAKTDLATFDVAVITDYLQTIGNSIVAVRNGSVVKLHVHTMTPDKVLAFCQTYGEFLKVKIENMSLQHNSNAVEEKTPAPQTVERKKYGIVAVASGEGLKRLFHECGADIVVDGGQSMNPSAEDLIEAFDRVNADVIFLYPNNGNIVLTAEQAAKLYEGSDVRVIPSTTLGAGYASLSMLDLSSGDTDAIVALLTEAMEGVITAEISHCIRDASMADTEVHTGDYIGFVGKELLAVNRDRKSAVLNTVDQIGFGDYDICILIYGKDANAEEAGEIEASLSQKYKSKEIYLIEGDQEVYDYILIVE